MSKSTKIDVGNNFIRFFSLKYNLIDIAVVALLVGCFVLAACRFLRFENPQSEERGFVNIEKWEFANEQLLLENRLFIPPQLEPRIENGEKVFDLAIQEGEAEFFLGKRTKTWGFNGNYLGPTLRARTNDKVRLNVTSLFRPIGQLKFYLGGDYVDDYLASLKATSYYIMFTYFAWGCYLGVVIKP